MAAPGDSSTADARGIAEIPDAREVLRELVDREIRTVTGRLNTVLNVGEAEVRVATARSPGGTGVPIAWVQDALRRLMTDGEIEISVASVGHRSAFLGAVLLTLPGTAALPTSPPRIRLTRDEGDAVDDAYRTAVAGTVNSWWEHDRSERYWLEISDRPDAGVDLHAPQRDARGNRSPGYSLMWWVQPQDIVFHYDLNRRAIVAWSRAVGTVTEAPVVWRSHRGATRRRISAAQAQPGWWLDLEGPHHLSAPLTLADLRDRALLVRSVLGRLQEQRSGSLYFPFFFYGGTQLRPMQPYLNKLPAALVNNLPELAEAARTATALRGSIGVPPPPGERLGTDYRQATVSDARDRREPFDVDPAAVERGLRGHADTQNALAATLAAAGITPRSPKADEPNFDLAWRDHDVIFVAEVKSITPQNEERQLRLGLGQVLRYRNRLSASGQAVRAVLVCERPPPDPTWQALCDELAVVLTYPERFPGILE